MNLRRTLSETYRQFQKADKVISELVFVVDLSRGFFQPDVFPNLVDF
jgi:hypothetical protein